MSEFYNEVIKNKYLDEIENEGSRHTIKYVFLASKTTEEIKEMDLYNFSKEDIELVMKNISPLTINSSKANASYISNYITWCIKHGYRENNLHPMDTVDSKWYSRFVNRTVKIHYSYEEFIDLLDEMKNVQDKILIFLMFEGLNNEQIRELTYNDIDFNNNTIYIRQRKENIPVDEKLIEYLLKSMDETSYEQYNPNTGEFNRKDLLPSNYIIKNIHSTRTVENEPIKINVIYKRLAYLKEIFNLQYLTPVALKQSGMIWETVKQFHKHNEVGYKQLAIVGEKYDYSTIINNQTGEPYINTHLMKQFVNETNIENLYGLNIEIKLR